MVKKNEDARKLWTSYKAYMEVLSIGWRAKSEKTREVTRPGQAGLSKILSLSAVPARRVTRSEGNL